MNLKSLKAAACIAAAAAMFSSSTVLAQMGHRWPSEKQIIPDPVTGVPLSFLTSGPQGDSKIYQTHQQWTADGKWLIFRGSRSADSQQSQAMAVNEQTGDIVQVTDNGFMGMLCNAHKSMKLFIMRSPNGGRRGAPAAEQAAADPAGGAVPATQPGRRGGGGGRGGNGGQQIVEIDLARIFADSAAGKMNPPATYERVCGTVPAGMNAGGNMGIDANDDFAYFSVTGPDTAQLSEGQTLQGVPEGARMGAGPSGLRSMNLKTGEVKMICNVGFQIGHVQTNPMTPGEIIFCWETGGKAPQRTWYVKSDGTGLRPLWPEAPYDWVTHEAAFNADEVAIAILAHRRPGQGGASTGEYPRGLGIVNLRTREMRIAGQVPMGNPGRSDWHVAASPDGRWAAFDDFQYRLWLIDRHNGETVLLADLGHKFAPAAADHIHPTFSLDSTRIEVQTAMIAPDGRALDICVVPVPKAFLARTYPEKLPE